MADNNEGTVHGASDGGVSGKHDEPQPPTVVVGPATSDQLNTIQLPPPVVACFRVDDIRFAFNSSFISSDPAEPKNDIRAELKLLVDLLKDHQQSPLSVFGHADPVGPDDYNKQLSGRRATVVYALLISKSDPSTAVKLWQGVAQQESWGNDQRQNMRDFTGLPAGTSDTDLFKAYMQKLSPAELNLTKQDFIGQGADSGGKADYQGCSSFNPVLVFSTKKNNALESQKDKTARNDANATNRRVLILLFLKGTKVDPTKWPCPRATEGITDCVKRFWAAPKDGNTRRKTRLPDQDRKFDDKNDPQGGTFACRFYTRMVTDQSPCEKQLTIVKIRLFDPQARPLPFAPCLITEPGKATRGDRATGAPPNGTTPGSPPGSLAGGNVEDAVVLVRVQNLPATVNIKWSRAKAVEAQGAAVPDPKDPDDFEYELDVAIDIPDADADADAATRARLKNLGYDTKPLKAIPLQGDPIRAFQRDYKPQFGDIAVDGTLNAPTVNAAKTAHDATNPVLRAGSDVIMKR